MGLDPANYILDSTFQNPNQTTLGFKLFQIFFDGNIESTSGHLYGLGAPFQTSANNFQDAIENGNSSWTDLYIRLICNEI